jgi:hypothetical protein
MPISAIRTLQTNAQGTFYVGALPVASPLTISAAYSGFVPTVSNVFVLSPGVTASVQLTMQIAAVHMEIHVTGEVGAIRTDEPQLGDRLTAEQMQSMPLLNRRVTWLPLLNAENRPAINQGDIFMNQLLFTANGTGRRQTWFEIDGANGNDMWGRQPIFTNVPLDSIAEMTVLNNAFAADYGFGEGAVVNIVTKGGSNRYHGDVLGLWRPVAPEAKLSGFSTTNAGSGNDITSDTLAQGAATLSGPLAPGWRTFFLASGEYSYQNRASPISSPLEPGSYVGHYRDWLGSLRLDRGIGHGHRVFLSGGAMPSIRTRMASLAAIHCQVLLALFGAELTRRNWATAQY